MWIAFIVFLALLVVAVIVTYFISRKTFKFMLKDKEITVKNAGAYLKVLNGKKVIESFYMPNLLQGETLTFKINEIEYILKCKCNSLGNKLSIQVYENENLIVDNGVKL